MTQPPYEGDGTPQQPYPQYQNPQQPPYPQQQHYAQNGPFGQVYDPSAQYTTQRLKSSGLSLRRPQIAGLIGFALLILGLVIGSVIGLVIVIVGAAGVLVGVVDAVRAVLAERRDT